jgi:hypothetical protein
MLQASNNSRSTHPGSCCQLPMSRWQTFSSPTSSPDRPAPAAGIAALRCGCCGCCPRTVNIRSMPRAEKRVKGPQWARIAIHAVVRIGREGLPLEDDALWRCCHAVRPELMLLWHATSSVMGVDQVQPLQSCVQARLCKPAQSCLDMSVQACPCKPACLCSPPVQPAC